MTFWKLGALAAAAFAGVALLTRRKQPTPRRTVPESVLLVGDSTAEGLASPIGRLARNAGVRFDSRATNSTRIDQWARNPELKLVLTTFKPEVVLVSLGTNDEYMGSDAVTRERPYLLELMEVIRSAGATLYWIGPPTLPKVTNGIVPMIKSTVPNYFPSDEMMIPRQSDQIHPTVEGYGMWANAIWAWMTT